MIKKFVLSFFTAAMILFSSLPVQAIDIPENNLNDIKKVTNDLEKIENLPSAEDIGLIASTIKNAASTYQSLRTKIVGTISFYQMLLESLKTFWAKIESGGFKLKEYIKDKIYLISESEINFLFT